MASSDRIQPYTRNPAYWQYRGRPVFLIGGDRTNNIFQNPDVHEELDALKAVGGNYIRSTMKSGYEGDVWPYAQDPKTGKYDLTQWNEEYWRRAAYFFKSTHERQIIVQMEIWATYDYYTRGDPPYPWDRNPYNPANNVNYTESESGLYELFRSTHGTLVNPFFHTVLPFIEETVEPPLVLGFQQKYVDKLLSISLAYDHILYCIDNETNADPRWALYWSKYIRNRAAERGVDIEVTEMWDTFDPTDRAVPEAKIQSPSVHFFTRRASVANTLNDPDNYSYLDIANHNFQEGEIHYKTGHWVWNKVRESGAIRPVNNVKIYGAGEGEFGSKSEGEQRFWRNVFAGSAAVRFHRQPSGLGNSELALAHIKSMRAFTDAVDISRLAPHNGLLSDRNENEAYCLAEVGRTYAVVFMDGGEVEMDVSALPDGDVKAHWLDILATSWREETLARTGVKAVTLRAPAAGFWLALVR